MGSSAVMRWTVSSCPLTRVEEGAGGEKPPMPRDGREAGGEARSTRALMKCCWRGGRFHKEKNIRKLVKTQSRIWKSSTVLDGNSQNKFGEEEGEADLSPEPQMSLSLPNDNYTQPIKTLLSQLHC